MKNTLSLRRFHITKQVFGFCLLPYALISLLSSALFAYSIKGWGSNGYGQATPPDGHNFIAIAAMEGQR